MSGGKCGCEKYMLICRFDKYFVVGVIGEKDIKDYFLVLIGRLVF